MNLAIPKKIVPVLGVTAGLVLGSAFVALAFQSPTANPPAENVSPPLTTGSEPQIKQGGLSLPSLLVEGSAAIGGYIDLQNIAQPGSPSSGIARMFFESVSGALKLKNSAGTVSVLERGQVQFFLYDSPGSFTWTKPAGIEWVYVEAIGGGGGGGGGARVMACPYPGGKGGGGGGLGFALFKASAVPSSVPVSVGTGGSGGPTIACCSTGNPGTNGQASTFGTLVTGKGGLLGREAVQTDGGAGGGALVGGVELARDSFGGTASSNAPSMVYVGGGGGGSSNQGTARAGGSSAYGGSGGGGGGGITCNDNVYFGGAGGSYANISPAVFPFAADRPFNEGRGGAGGQGGRWGASDAQNGFTPGGGGGGGGSNGRTDTSETLSGAGGNGARGEVRVWAW
ncbi:MAG: hypothetical protein Q8P39_02830 [Candidatus Yanofskybacteria bacterium]|nr:hypothetical protein [Candidatus Yanofskybacteria bacterium]